MGILALVLIATSMLGINPAHADCPVLDVSCVDETVGEVQDQVVEPAFGTVLGTVEETVETVEETVGSVLDGDKEIVDGVVGGVPGDADPVPELPAPGTGTEPGTGIISPPVANGPPANDGPQGGGARPPEGAAAPLTATGTVGPRDPVSNVAAEGISLDPPAAGDDRSFPVERSTSLPRLIGTALAFPAILAIAVLLFVAVQNRLDRADPRLALATMRPEVVRFE